MTGDQHFPDWEMKGVMDDVSVTTRTAKATDHEFIHELMERWKCTQGFLPNNALPRWIAEGRILVTETATKKLGYIATSGGLTAPIIVRHNSVATDEQRKGVGTWQMYAVCRWACRMTRYDHIRVRTRTDIIAQQRINIACGGKVKARERNQHTKEAQRIEEWIISIKELRNELYK